jgi:uncharacterized protein (DUF4415 family)
MRENKSTGEKRGSPKGGLLRGKRSTPKLAKGRPVKTAKGKVPVREVLGLLNAMQQVIADRDEAPELTEEFFERADVYHGNKLIRPGRPPSANPKLALKLRIDPDVVEYFRATGPGWQTRINDTLRREAKLPTRER